MSRSGREYLFGGRSGPAGPQSHHRRGHSLVGVTSSRNAAAAADENLDLFSKNRRSISVASSDESSDAASSIKLGRLSVGSVAKVARSGLDDLLTSTDGGKHDYDWLLTPPGTPLFPSSDGNESQSNTAVPRSSSNVRSTSTTKVSRLSVSQSETTHSSRPTRSSSVTRPSISTSQYSTYSSNRSSSILNTSSASVSSYTRPSSPLTRSSSAARPSTPSARATASRSSTPSRIRPVSTSSSIEKPRPSQNSRPSTPSSRPQIAANISSTTPRSNSRPSTPTRRSSAPSPSPSAGTSISSGRVLSNGRSGAPASRPSSPSPRLRSPQQPIVPPDFSLETPPNLRTTLPDRPLSAGRSRPGAAVTVKGNSDILGPVNATRRQPSPITTRGRVATAESTGRGRVHANATDIVEPRRSPNSPELGMRKPVKSVTSLSESTGFGRTISKKSLDMAIRHMDIKNGAGGNRALSGTTLFPQSIRSSASKNQSARIFSAPPSINGNGNQHNMNDVVFMENGSRMRTPPVGSEAGSGRYSAKLTEVDIYESSRYDAMLLKEDLKNTNWLHSFDDKSDQGLIFDNGFESLPEPFAPL
ncbi:serine/arginine repetitive matrix protein 1 isoform X1 [Eucalyptus grandis]|uniref:serine/arginine repetitive matrix protein 1 isoform X1 n=1 Tax=Eucalyptus grandis TaxID=71139 RepID=UPI00192F080D|nr:serine/arginine repetitive matrix protein 1 isoform X1 [Eucalyptus grandis]